MINKTEKEIMQNWQRSEMEVSILCVAFNHEHFIGEALDGFLMQETSFPFEILINDDASTDKTGEIIKEYEKKYPNIVKPDYQSENQFSQGIGPSATLFPRITGKYVTFGDGDDYWIDKDKLKIQVEEMEKLPNVDMSFHPSYQLLDGQRKKVLSKHSDKNRIFTPKEIILGGGEFCPTASLMFTNRLISSLPVWFSIALPNDYICQIMGAANSGALYIDRCMSIYRVGELGSWTSRLTKEDSGKRKKSLLTFHHSLDLINEMLNNEYQKEIDLVIFEENLDFIKTRRIDVVVREEVYKLYKNTFSLKEKALWYLLYRNQNLLNSLKLILNIRDKIFKSFSLIFL